jgi:protein-tyrosine phosphatase
MGGFIDLHCHFIPGVDDGVKTPEEGLALLRALAEIGFEQVIGTPHMRPNLFDNSAEQLRAAFNRFQPLAAAADSVPAIGLSSEHYFDEVVFRRLLSDEGLPYPGGRAVLLEFYDIDFMPAIAERLFDLRRKRLVPVIAHPERYRCFWKTHERLAELIGSGAVALLDAAALVGKYGKEPQRCARRLLEEGLYFAACSDAHRPADVEDVADGIRYIRKKYGADELELLFRKGPQAILDGTVDR